MSKKNKNIDITPPVDIYKTFKNYNYRVGTAIPEFVDNSIQSFRNNEKIYNEAAKKGKVIEKSITLIFNKKEKKIIIRDSAFGMTIEDIPSAFKLKSNDGKKTGLNEFGMGLKTAAFWFGDSLKVVTKSPRSKDGFSVEMNMAQLTSGISEIPIKVSKEYINRWGLNNGTVIIISDIDRNRDLSNTQLKKVVQTLASKYRRDVLNGNIEFRTYSIEANGDTIDLNYWIRTSKKKIMEKKDIHSGEVLRFEPTKRWQDEKTDNGHETKVAFSVEHFGDTYNVNGEFFMRAVGSRPEAGIDLFRRGRIIEEKNKEFIKGAGSYEYQRINGYLELDDFPVTQAKDRIEWEGKLFERVKEKLMNDDGIIKLIKIAKTTKYRTENKVADLKKVTKSYKNKLAEMATDNLEILETKETKAIATSVGVEYNENDVAHIIKTNDGDVKIYSSLVLDGSIKGWIDIQELKDGTMHVKLDVNHSFFNPFNSIKGEGAEFVATMRTFATFWARAEKKSMEYSETAEEFRDRMSELIEMNGENNE